ncbi:unnamed protein product [Cylindrotheca closterium]|uniref:Methyltransferase FkbM domain-containing protein n=1 Tax=Cylindrotheca closterium TaxID=2856 RepID=A0AAD2JKZ2_9STRA|nr:unnamed protein product [Cylindrotheca closterium]
MKVNPGVRAPYYFVDLASNDAIDISNTVRLEEEGWNGLCVEPNPVYWYRLAHRKCRMAGTFVGGNVDGAPVDVTLENKAFGGIVGDEMDNKPSSGAVIQKRFTISIKTLFESFAVPSTINYMSLDVEGAEEIILESFPFDSYRICILTVERPNLNVQATLKSHGYLFVSTLMYFGETLWIHQSILSILDMSRILTIVATLRKNKRPKKGELVFDMESGVNHVFDGI